MRYHSTKAHPNNTFARKDGLWLSSTGERYGWDASTMYPCVATPVANYGPQDHSDCRMVPQMAPGGPATRKITCYPVPHSPTYRVRGIDTDAAEALDYAHEDWA